MQNEFFFALPWVFCILQPFFFYGGHQICKEDKTEKKQKMMFKFSIWNFPFQNFHLEENKVGVCTMIEHFLNFQFETAESKDERRQKTGQKKGCCAHHREKERKWSKCLKKTFFFFCYLPFNSKAKAAKLWRRLRNENIVLQSQR